MNSEKIQYLAWDSDFFKIKTGRIWIANSDHLAFLLKEAKNTNYQLIYVFGNKDFFVGNDILMQFNGKLVDKKVLFEKEVENKKQFTVVVSEYTHDELIAELAELAYISGEFSRFKLDKNFQKDDFYRMYTIWIDHSVKRKIADNVFVVKENGKIKGMVTLKNEDKIGQIGLIAVAPDTQGKGYGKALISACEKELHKKGIVKMNVTTQLDNIQACQFYGKCGFHIKDITNIYHFWL